MGKHSFIHSFTNY